MRQPFLPVFAVVAASLVLACGGGGGDDGGPAGPGGTSNVTAKIDGTTWHGVGAAARASGGIYTISGASTGTFSLVISLYNISGTGTYGLGINATGFGGTGIVADASGGWSTPLTGMAGTITLTTLTDTRIAGTFSYTATPISGSAAGTKVVTEGSFDMTLTTAGTWNPPTAWAGSSIEATIAGAEYVAATTAVVFNSGTLIFTGTNTTQNLSFTLQSVAGADTYLFSDAAPIRRITLTGDGASPPIWTTDGTSGGSVIVTSLDANRIIGTFSTTLHPLAGTSAAGNVVLSGEFNLGIPHF